MIQTAAMEEMYARVYKKSGWEKDITLDIVGLLSKKFEDICPFDQIPSSFITKCEERGKDYLNSLVVRQQNEEKGVPREFIIIIK